MALTTLSPFPLNAVPGEGVQFSPSTPGATEKMVIATADFEYINDGRTCLLVNNAGAGSTVIAFTLPNIDGGGGVIYAPSGVGDTVPAGKWWIFSPFPTKYNNSAGKIVGTIGTLTTVYIGAMQLPLT